jgi:cell shape-determining protein MreC
MSIVEEAKEYIKDIHKAFPGTYQSFIELVEKLIQEVERLRPLELDSTFLKGTALEIESLTKEVEELKNELWIANGGIPEDGPDEGDDHSWEYGDQ